MDIIKKLDNVTIEITTPAVVVTKSLSEFTNNVQSQIDECNQRILALQESQNSYNSLIQEAQDKLKELVSQLESIK